ncbi:hypothetical protein QN360_18605 [Glaciimonas sp. CA11.2]|uniref:hypothetical protein n=1 Tax=unclassified Glaciimonas TaxID=2644401 RepID=UPI002AB368DD|nr:MULTISPECIES: hypothetical protein [unclassified Glaciimonas]MDY7547593.1 hypothetical protein [Glaciimonas sp. CA11.2]MEB0014459.1 hypothetical protein [Glaciimonas sp. Cout2]MEB0084008.1 hypothetical protein [Glaciimonas sp. Gout2]MEB0164908.1 hypothetical protein [Glaciimonas sp. CA11.2]
MSKPIPPSSSDSEAFHQPFSWLPHEYQNDRAAQFYALTVDVCRGVQTCIDLVHLSNADRGTSDAPTLTVLATERLLRLALTSSQMLAENAERRIDRLALKTSLDVD